MERRAVVVSALAWVIFAGCAPAVLPAPASRAEACGRIGGASIPAALEFCDAVGSPCRPDAQGRPQRCIAGIVGEQPFCFREGLWREPAMHSPYPCYPENGGADCPAWWQCRSFDHPFVSGGDPGRWCFPGPVCGTDGDAGASGG